MGNRRVIRLGKYGSLSLLIRKASSAVVSLSMAISAISATLVCSSAYSDDLTVNLELDETYYFEDGLYGDRGFRGSVGFGADYEHWFLSDKLQFSLQAFGRSDQYDGDRSNLDARVFKLQYVSDSWSLSAGYDEVFWGVMESKNIVNVINQINYKESINGDIKLGQPMVRFSLDKGFGEFELFALFGHRKILYGDQDGRLNLAFLVDDDAFYRVSGASDNVMGGGTDESSRSLKHIDTAIRWAYQINDLELAVSVFNGTNRVPFFDVVSEGEPFSPEFDVKFVAIYDQVSQFGLELQYIVDEWLIKSEIVRQNNTVDDYTAISFGLENTLVGVFDSNADLSLFAEYLYDDRGDTALPGVFTHDILLAGKLYFNDQSSTSLQASAIFDHLNHESSLTFKLNRRLSDLVSFELEARSFSMGSGYSTDKTMRLIEFSTSNNESINNHEFLTSEDYVKAKFNFYF